MSKTFKSPVVLVVLVFGSVFILLTIEFVNYKNYEWRLKSESGKVGATFRSSFFVENSPFHFLISTQDEKHR